MIELRYNTADQEVPLGYYLDSTDGDTEETGLTIANTDIKLWKWGATTLATKNSGEATHISNGIYYAVLDATDTNTLGPMKLFCHVSGALSFELEVNVVSQQYWDAKYGSGNFSADVKADSIDLATGTDISDLQTHGDSTWATATGFMLATEDGSSFDSIPDMATAAAQATAQLDLDILTGSDGVTLATAQANYAPAKAGDEMDLVDAPNATAIIAIQNGLSTLDGADILSALGLASGNLDTQLSGIASDVTFGRSFKENLQFHHVVSGVEDWYDSGSMSIDDLYYIIYNDGVTTATPNTASSHLFRAKVGTLTGGVPTINAAAMGGRNANEVS